MPTTTGTICVRIPKKSNVLIEYNAVVNQTSGEDWASMALSLSTAEPTMIAGLIV